MLEKYKAKIIHYLMILLGSTDELNLNEKRELDALIDVLEKGE